MALLLGPDVVIRLDILNRVIEALFHRVDLFLPVVEIHGQNDGDNYKHEDDGNGDHNGALDFPLAVWVVVGLIEEDRRKGVCAQVLRLHGQQQVLYRVHRLLRLVRGVRKRVLQKPVVQMLPHAPRHERGRV